MPTFGFVPIANEFEAIREEARLAESLGFDGCYFVEHHQQPGIVASPLVMAAAVAGATERITIGTGIIVLPLYHPVHVAEDGATIDRISGGRFVLGVGLGYQSVDFGAFDVPIRQRVSLFEESVEIIRRLWTEDNVTFVGKRYRLDKVRLYPKPVQDPHPPIWLAGGSEEAVKRAARLGDAWMADPIIPLSGLKSLGALYHELAQKRGRPGKIVALRETLIAETREEAERDLVPSLLATYRYYWKTGAFNPVIDPWVKEIGSTGELTLDLVRDRLLIGSPDDIADQIGHWRSETGVDDFVCIFQPRRGQGHTDTLRAIRLFAEGVIPKFAGTPAPAGAR